MRRALRTVLAAGSACGLVPVAQAQFVQNFDSTPVGSLPPGWGSLVSGAGQPWAVSAGRRLGPRSATIDFPWARDAEAADKGEGGELEMGPPPPGYWRITSEPVPNWTPASGHPTDSLGPWS